MKIHGRLLPLASLFTVALGLTACMLEDESLEDEESGIDAGADLADFSEFEGEWEDDGPLPEDEHSDEVEAVEDDHLRAFRPRFQMPFPCGQVWAGQTRTNHSPTPSIDFNRSGDFGDPVVASAAGRVTRVGNTGNTSYGRWIEISHGNGYTTRYAHLKGQRVSVGQRVRMGQRIGAVGSSGGSTGPHLHYEQRHNGNAIRVRFNGAEVAYYGTRSYRSRNACGGGGAAATVQTSGAPLNVRSGPGTGYQAVGSLADGAHVTISCQTLGQRVTGTYGTTRLWDKIGKGYVSDAFVYTGSDGRVAPDCP